MNFKRLLVLFISLIMLVSLVSCDVSSYKALMLVRITKDDFCEVSFSYLDGELVMKPRYTVADEGQIHYTAHLDEGEINVYYECASGVKELLFNIKAGENLDSRGGYIERGRQKIYIETITPAKGKITLEFE